jgi:C-terminal processing protease CtpA/Prc
LTEQARERIRSADELGQMHGAISALLYQLHDSHTVFIPPKRRIKAVYGFKAKPFAQNISTMLDFMGQFVHEPFEMATSVSRKKSEPIRVKPLSPHISGALYVLIDSESASASEMFARSMQIHKRAVLIGDRSSGSVSSARFFWEPIGSSWEAVEFGTEIAVSKIVMENGEELEGRGVTPDEFCIPQASDLNAERDPCLDRALAMARAVKN